MSLVVLWGAFLLKHGLLAHVVDFGYSYSRAKRKWWPVGFVGHVVAEATLSLFLLQQHSVKQATVVLGIEFVALAVSTLAERKAPLRRLLVTHVVSELFVLLVYGALAFYLVRYLE